MPIRASRTATAIGALALTGLLVAGAAGAATARTALTPDQTGGAARHADQTKVPRELKDALGDGKVDNVILLIGDGMGDSEITIARDYLVGAGGTLAGIDSLPATGQYTTYSLYKDGPYAGQARLRPRLRGDRHRMGDRHQDLRQRGERRHPRRPARDAARAREGERLQDREREHRRDPGRHPGRADRARRPAILLRPRLDRRAERTPS